MFEIIFILVASVFLANLFQQNAVYIENQDPFKCGWKAKSLYGIFVYGLLLVLIILFVGLRRVGNDTGQYLNTYINKILPFPEEIEGVDWSIGANPGFHIYQAILKCFFGENGLWLTFITAIISTVSFFEFFRRYSRSFFLVVFFFVSLTSLAFTMGAMKQTIAMALSIWVLPLALKKKWCWIGCLLFIAMLIHPYVIFFIGITFLMEDTWNWKIKTAGLVTLVIICHFSSFVEIAVNSTDLIGDKYDLEYWGEGTGVNLLRLPFYLITPVLAYVYRREINQTKNIILIVTANLSFISGIFMILAACGGANMFGRLANYWELFAFVALATMLHDVIPVKKRGLIIGILVICSLFFYFKFYLKFQLGLWDCCYMHASLFDLFF